ncbi:MAG TPA: DUF4252 domain-containing protein [Candidatus Kapabacteria bacterium]|nr:DUF4252 domain-containing protein [Candidatus Kapabacteria bacterium]
MIHKYTILFFILFVSLTDVIAQNKNIERIINNYSKLDGFTSVQIKDPAKTLPNMNKDKSKELKDLLEGVEIIRVLKMDKNKVSSETSNKFINEVSSFNPGDGFKELLSVKESGNFVKMHIKEAANKNVSDLLMVAGENKQVTLIWFNGKLDLEKLQKSAAILPHLLR